MSETKQRTPEEVKAREAKKGARKNALNVLKELVDKQQDPKYKKALGTIRPSLYGLTSSSGSGASSKFIAFVTDKKEVSEDVIFKEFKLGRKDCAGYIRKHLRKSDPQARVWISFNASSGMYKVVGRGVKTPAGWTGYVPVDENIDLK